MTWLGVIVGAAVARGGRRRVADGAAVAAVGVLADRAARAVGGRAWRRSRSSSSRCASRSLIGIPLGHLGGPHDRGVERVLRPVLDAMQTIPAFSYLLPLVLLFGIGAATAIISTVIFALPPAIRLTSLGIRGVPPTAARGRGLVRLDRAADAAQGAAAAGEALDHARRQPDDHDGARHGRDRGDRRARPAWARACSTGCSASTSGEALNARDRDRGDGDRARPRELRVEPARPAASQPPDRTFGGARLAPAGGGSLAAVLVTIAAS